MTPQSVMFDDTQVDTKILPGLGIKFDFPKPLSFVRRLVEASTSDDAVVLDCFAGSGTTVHAVIDMNRTDGKRRRFVMFEHADYFDNALKLRCEKLMFSPAWKDGRPARLPTPDEAARAPRFVKVLRLESYEDALHNIATAATLAASEEKAEAYKDALGVETYRLNYFIRLPLEASASMLQTDWLDHPFRYQLDVPTDEGPERRMVDSGNI